MQAIFFEIAIFLALGH